MQFSRRQFNKMLVPSLLLAPFWPYTRRQAKAASSGTGVKRLIFVTSLGIGWNTWIPTSSAGAPVTLSANTMALAPVLDDIVMINGLSGPQPGENHGTSQHTTALSFGDTSNKTSIETYLAQTIAPSTPLPTMVLGAAASNSSQFFNQGHSVPVTQSPLDAYNLAFGGSSSSSGAATTGNTTTAPSIGSSGRKSVLDLLVGEIKSLQSGLGSQETAKLQEHLASIETLENQMTATASCSTAVAPNLMGLDPTNSANTLAMGQLFFQLMPQLLNCGVTNLISFQWGISNQQVINGSTTAGGAASGDEHNSVHSGQYGTADIQAAEYLLCQSFAGMISQLKSMPDASSPGKSLLDTTLVCWTRDIGNGPQHSQESVPYILAGGTSYIAYNSGGTYYDLTNQGSTRRILLNVLEAFGASPAGFGCRNGEPITSDFNNPSGGNTLNTQVVSQIKVSG